MWSPSSSGDCGGGGGGQSGGAIHCHRPQVPLWFLWSPSSSGDCGGRGGGQSGGAVRCHRPLAPLWFLWSPSSSVHCGDGSGWQSGGGHRQPAQMLCHPGRLRGGRKKPSSFCGVSVSSGSWVVSSLWPSNVDARSSCGTSLAALGCLSGGGGGRRRGSEIDLGQGPERGVGATAMNVLCTLTMPRPRKLL